jgi:protein-L-isoaspartate(D-aspartate) O-methyltransferase
MYKNQAHHNMVEQQMRPWEILDSKVLSAFTDIPRENFVSQAQKPLAYADIQLPIGHGQKMLEPKVEGRMLQALEIKPTDRVLEVGTGSGFVTALLASLAKRVDSVEINQELADFAKENLQATEFTNINLQKADALDASYVPAIQYDVIILGGSVATLPEHLLKALKVGGRMFVFIAKEYIAQAAVVSKINDEVLSKDIFETNSLPLIQDSEPAEFTF